MIKKINFFEAQWFSRQCCSDSLLITESYPYRIGIPHPETRVSISKTPPFCTNSPDDLPLSNKQKQTIENIFLSRYDNETFCNFAIYAGYFSDDWGVSAGFDETAGVWVLGGDLPYVLFSAQLAESLFTVVERKWQHVNFIELSYVWSLDYSWFLASPPDTGYTIISTNDGALAKDFADADIETIFF